MISSEEPGPFGLKGEQYWQEPLWQKSSRQFAAALLHDDVEGIFIDAPSKVYMNRHNTFPICAFHAGSTERLQKHSFHSTIQLVVSHLETGIIHIVKPGLNPGNPEPESSPGWLVQDLEVDIFSILDLNPKLGRYSAWILNGPEKSNQRPFELYPSSESERSPEVLARLELLRKEGGSPQPLFQGKNWGILHQASNPKEESIPLWKLTKRPSGKSPFQIDLEYRIEGLPRFLLQKDKPPLDKSGKRIYANLPILILGFDGNRELVIKQDIGLPVRDAPEGAVEKPILSGHATIDVGLMLEGKKPVKSLTIWAIAMDHRSMVELEMETGKAEEKPKAAPK